MVLPGIQALALGLALDVYLISALIAGTHTAGAVIALGLLIAFALLWLALPWARAPTRVAFIGYANRANRGYGGTLKTVGILASCSSPHIASPVFSSSSFFRASRMRSTKTR